MTELFWSGCYSPDLEGGGDGIGALRRRADGTLQYVGTAAETASPSCLIQHPLLTDVLYATLEGSGRLEGFRRTGSTTLTSLGSQPASGPFPCQGSVSADARTLFTASYGDGSLGLVPLAQDGSLGPPDKALRFSGGGPHPHQDGPHGHAALMIDESSLMSLDLGTDHVRLFEVSRGHDLRLLHTMALPPGSGPRDLLVHPGGLFYLLTELSNELFVLSRSADRTRLSIVSSTPLSPGAAPDVSNQPAGLSLSADGRFVYAGVRGDNVIATLAVQDGGRRLERVCEVPTGGDWPRHHLVDSQILYVCNQLSNTITCFSLDPRSGVPEPLGRPEPVPSPTFLLRAGSSA